jgi:hypothetical protein
VTVDRASPQPGAVRTGRLAIHLWDTFSPVLVLLSPPRCGSTALARGFWRHPMFRWYLHEPYDRVHHRGAGWESVRRAVAGRLDVNAESTGSGMIIKEMTFQARSALAELMAAATLPVVFTVRDPRLALRSRVRQRVLGGQDPAFPDIESGWRDLATALELARARGVRYVVVEFTALRDRPADLMPALCRQLGLAFTPTLLSWPARESLSLGGLGGEQDHWYARALASTGFTPSDETVPDAGDLPGPLREHAAECVELYQRVLRDPHLIGPVASGRPA